MKKFSINLKSNKGFTMQDLVIAIIILMAFIGIISTMFYSIYKINYQTKLTANATYYAVQILEDIDKISYEEVENSLADRYVSDLPSRYSVKLEVTPYKDEDYAQNLVKNVKLTVSYTFLGTTEELIIQRIKVKEV